jgi:nucleotide-binding universal stress UspA family protein
VLVLTGQPSDTLLRAMESEAADLVAMGASRRELLRNMFSGTTVERVIRNASRPVLMVNKLPTGPYRRVLAATGLAAPSAHALRVASALGLLAGADLTVLHAFWQPGKAAPILTGSSTDEVAERRESLALDAQADLHRFLAGIGLPSAPPPRAIVREGAPGAVIKEEAGRLRSDLVLMGTEQRGALSTALLGSVAAEVLSVVECDVLVVPPGNSGEGTAGAPPPEQPGAAPTGGDDP